MTRKQLFLLTILLLLLCSCSITSVGYHGGITVPVSKVSKSKQPTTPTRNISIVPVSGVFLEIPRAKTVPLKIRFDGEFIFGHRPDFFTSRSYPFEGMYMNVLLKWKFSPYTSPYILAGGRSGIYASSLPVSKEESEGEKNENTVLIDYGFVIGSGIEFDAKGLTFFLEWRYHYGLGKLKSVQFAETYNRFQSITMGIQFHHIIGGKD